MKKDYNIELKGEAIGRFREYCRDMHIKTEPSEAGFGYVHFICEMTEQERKDAEEFLSKMEGE